MIAKPGTVAAAAASTTATGEAEWSACKKSGCHQSGDVTLKFHDLIFFLSFWFSISIPFAEIGYVFP
jgi:hypothetical protein